MDKADWDWAKSVGPSTYQYGDSHREPGIPPQPDELVAPASPESIIESIKMTRQRKMEMGCSEETFRVTWTAPDGEDNEETRVLCFLCGMDTAPRHRPWLMLASYVPWRGVTASAPLVAYMLAVPTQDSETGEDTWTMEGRIGIRSQWKDPMRGNQDIERPYPELATDWVFGESGPGVYPCPIEELPPEIDFSSMGITVITL